LKAFYDFGLRKEILKGGSESKPINPEMMEIRLTAS
jgi:hypothetical protein